MPRLDETEPGREAPPPDLRMPLLAVAAWMAGLAALAAPTTRLLLIAAVTVTGTVWAVRRPRARATLAGCLLVGAAVLTSALVRTEAITDGPLADLARQRAAVEVVGVVTSDPRVIPGPYGDQVVVGLRVEEVVARGLVHRVSSPVLVLGDPVWRDVALGQRVSTTARLAPAGDSDLAALLPGPAAPETVSEPDVWWRGAERVRASIRDAVAHRPDAQRALVPALVDGDDAGLDPTLEEDFRTTGLTHLTAVSGTNLTLIVGFLVVIARWCGVRGRWLVVIAAAGIVGFVLLARTEPSVVRAAAMGTVGLVALTSNGRQRALRGLAVAVVVLLLVQPSLATSPGFALSAMATGGIVLLAPSWRDAWARWMPRWLAEAVAVPAAAQLACTPVVAALSGQVSLVAVPANLLVAPLVGPATVLGLLGGLVGLGGAVGEWVARLCGTGAGWCVGWIVLVATRGADVPLAAVDWSTGPVALVGLVLLCVALVVMAPLVLRAARAPAGPGTRLVAVGLAGAVLVAGAVVVRAGLGGWPAPGWVMAMCDVGQGDALVLRAGPGVGVVVDAGPDPDAVDACLDRLGVTEVPLLVLTHFHADHVDGIDGVLRGRHVGEVWTTNLLDPPGGVSLVTAAVGGLGLVATTAPTGTTTVGDVTLRPLWPADGPPHLGPGDGSTANEASVVLLAEVQGVQVLLTGDLEPPGQAALAATLGQLDVDVLKVPHHGSRYQDLDVLTSVDAEVALVSVGADNDYGHPAPDVLAALVADGTEIARTDEDGDVLIVHTADGVRTVVAR